MNLGEYLSVISILVAILIGVISWVLSAYLTKKNIDKRRLQYELRMHSIVSKDILKIHKSLEIYYNGELLPEPSLLTLSITNTGSIAIENPPIEIEMPGATYIIPGHIEDIPPGYEDKWTLERVDAEVCKVKIEHINPGQTLNAVFFIDEYPESEPIFKCAMKNLEVKKIDSEMLDLLQASINAGSSVSVVPSIISNVRLINRIIKYYFKK